MITVILFFTRGVSLQIWDKVGMLAREVALYRRLLDSRVQIYFVTYGDKSELNYTSRLTGIRILCNRWNLPGGLYEHLIPWLHAPWLRRADIIKTNQTNGADLALSSARLWHKPLIARSGFILSDHLKKESGSSTKNIRRALETEAAVFNAAQRIVVTTLEMADSIKRRIPSVKERIHVIPNYVDTDSFIPKINIEPEFDLVFVGRLNLQKNLFSLVDAIESLNLRLLIIGDGELHDELVRRKSQMNGQIEWHTKIPNEHLCDQLHRARVFILPSHYEGHPKALLEAMASGMPVIGANSPGIREVIQHGVNGWVCETDPNSIRAAIQKLIANAELQNILGIQARKYIVDNLSLDRILKLELALYSEILDER